MSKNLTLIEAIKFIVKQVDKPNDKDQRAWENLIRTRFNRGVTKDKNGKYSLNDVLFHARKWYGLEPFKSFPLPPITVSISSYLDDCICTASVIVFSVPNNLDECKVLISELNTEIYQLKEEIKQRDGEIERLQPLAEQYLKNCATKQKSAKKPRHS